MMNMKKNIIILLSFLTGAVVCSCVSKNEVAENTNLGNFEALWKIIDEKYCLFEDKKIDWDQIHDEYHNKVKYIENDNEQELFDTLESMVDKLEDGHVNIYTDFDISYSSKWYDGYPYNFNESLLYNKYIKDYRIAGGMDYATLKENIGYIRYSSFSDDFTQKNLYYVLSSFGDSCKAIILDVRNNGGGSIVTALKLASVFFNNTTTIGYIQHKTGKEHDAFSEPEEMIVDANSTSIKWLKPVIILANRRSYSATNLFLSAMKQCKNRMIIGGKSGGGGGMPLSYELPNGWMVRFSSVKMTNLKHISIENGIEPDRMVNITSSDKDDILEYAIEFIENL